MKHKTKNNARTKVIKDIDFNKLWKSANSEDNENEFVVKNHEWPYRKYKMEYDVFSMMLHRIYIASKRTFKDIIDANNYSKSKVSNAFCIPIRTVEDWYTGKNKCPGHIRLMLLRYFKDIDLGKYIKVESVYEYDSTIPRVYKKEEPEKKEELSLKSIEKMYASDLILSKTNYLDEIINRHNK